MGVSAAEIKERLRVKSGKKVRTSISVDPNLLRDFQKACADIPMSAVLEELMREFIASEKQEPKKR